MSDQSIYLLDEQCRCGAQLATNGTTCWCSQRCTQTFLLNADGTIARESEAGVYIAAALIEALERLDAEIADAEQQQIDNPCEARELELQSPRNLPPAPAVNLRPVPCEMPRQAIQFTKAYR